MDYLFLRFYKTNGKNYRISKRPFKKSSCRNCGSGISFKISFGRAPKRNYQNFRRILGTTRFLN